MAHNVICLYCKNTFDRDKEPTKQVNQRRYAHLACWENYQANLTQEEKDQIAFYEYTKKLFGTDYNYIVTKKLAERYIKENKYTYNGMLKTLKWYYEKEGNSLEKSNGTIGIIPYKYKEAANYYYTLYKAQLVNQTKDMSEYSKIQERVVKIPSPRVYVRPPHLWLEDDEEQEE